ncbi:hypothetical protein AMAG_17470 [Allomyces macrogynus ATCC 38327]|uniref:MMS19 nucleotide excision repair protein n=1 Tax=Allomyces macrogynus (strain ATCC 38327) TaxID=578462 RepID=A0A0L0TEY0_ALLM3|nr:hypothetical protein AMAG_17470 [Allomyces macrogynus ATCC 38327]|eukprot:KNE73302.1 hypothetical protein AMAG_17470 [Allomyces macrogynus ATCC 38327]
MATPNQLVAALMTDAGPEAVSNLAQSTAEAIAEQSNTFTLLQLVEQLQPVLTHHDAFVREKGISLLTKVLAAIAGQLQPQEARVIWSYFTSQLRDPMAMAALCQGILVLLESKLIDEPSLLAFVRALFAEVNVQSFQQTTRHLFFRIFDYLVQNHLDSFRRAMEADFLVGYMTVMDGEKDPRNLMLAFKTVATLARQCNVASCAQDLFETCFCYFPITFKPPPDDPYGISAQDLKSALLKCLIASPLFAPFAIPSVLEKLDSTNNNAKRDTLAVLSDGLPVYGVVSLLPHVPRLWKALKNEIYHAPDAAHEELALGVLGVALKVLSVTGESRTNPVDLILNPGIHECLQHLGAPETKFAHVAGHVLRAMAQSSADTADHVVSLTVPYLLGRLTADDKATHQKTYLDALAQVLDGCAVHTTCPATLRPLAPEIYATSTIALRSPSAALQSHGLRVLALSMRVHGLLGVSERATCARHMLALLDPPRHAPAAPDLQNEAIAALVEVARADVPLVRQWVLPPLIDPIGASPDVLNRAQLRALAALAQVDTLFSEIVHALVVRVRALADLPDLAVLLDTVLAVLQTATSRVDGEHVQAVLAVADGHAFAPGVVQKLAEVAAAMMRKLPSADAQQAIVNALPADLALNDAARFPVVASVLGNVQRSVAMPVPERDLVRRLLDAQMPGTTPLVACICNKSADSDAILADSAVAARLAAVKDANALELLCWIAKALVMRGHKQGNAMVAQILGLLHDPALQRQAARGLGIVAGEYELFLNRHSFAVTKLLYKQRVFHFCLPKIIEAFHSGTDKDVSLLALGCLLQNVPQQVLLSSIKDLVPLLLQSLAPGAAQDDELVRTALATFTMMVHDAPQVVTDHLTSLLPHLMRLSTPAGAKSMHVRIAALQCLGELAALKYAALHPVKGTVLKGLGQALDDPKRMVRREAVNCRAKWYLVGK